MNSIVTQRFIQCLNELKSSGTVRSARQFAQNLDFLPQNLSEMNNGKRDVTIELLRKAIETFYFNPEYIFLGEGKKILKPEDKDKQMRVLSIQVQPDGNERIVHVPVPAQAGYASESRNPEFIGELPSYSLPDYRFKTGTYRSFDVNGDSMEPTFDENDRVICSFMDPSMWKTSIRDGNVYIIVTNNDILLKRIDKTRHPHLTLHSDNADYDPYRLHLREVKEIWHVRYKLTNFDHTDNYTVSKFDHQESLQELRKMLTQQSQMIEHLTQQLQEMKARELA
jgi:hypothetical protein